jgi:hypothetical protein
MSAIKYFLKWFLIMIGIFTTVGCGLSSIVALIACNFIAAAICAIVTAAGVSLAITSWEYMN